MGTCIFKMRTYKGKSENDTQAWGPEQKNAWERKNDVTQFEYQSSRLGFSTDDICSRQPQPSKKQFLGYGSRSATHSPSWALAASSRLLILSASRHSVSPFLQAASELGSVTRTLRLPTLREETPAMTAKSIMLRPVGDQERL